MTSLKSNSSNRLNCYEWKEGMMRTARELLRACCDQAFVLRSRYSRSYERSYEPADLINSFGNCRSVAVVHRNSNKGCCVIRAELLRSRMYRNAAQPQVWVQTRLRRACSIARELYFQLQFDYK